ncbi:alpha/beta-Hydrolases superfamily protein [Striga asiatica]|uniref:Alpha/beta-Hydrolases superfamily protein n=1 Tax=Striga asiatica TaxID=4170 RepID=A0A5A7QD09_STRAF|nr:alpha/beta-Hydrolases superfamily protein [Striga asiatica]
MRLSISKPVRTCTKPHCHTITNPKTKNTLTTKVFEIPKRTLTNLPIDANPKLKTSPSFLDQLSHDHPTRIINKRWMDYQGSKNWEGMLDPLDDNLRSEIIRYGHFVEAAYRSCDFDPSSPSYATCRFPKRKLLEESGFPHTGYRVTKNLVATSGIELPDWAQAPVWMVRKSAWIGYVAVCHDPREISRLGRRDVVVAFRGTATGLEWVENLRATLSPLHFNNPQSVESGFLSLYTSGSEKNRPSLRELVRQEISRVLRVYGQDERLSFTITGHSLGAALATLAAYDIKETFGKSRMVTVVSFAGPRVGNRSFRCQLDRQGTKILRIVNNDDVVTKVPGFVGEGWVQKLVEDAQWGYADVGCELRLSTRDSPYLNGTDLATCHDLKTYLHLVDGFVGSNCPFRATPNKMMMTRSTN